MQFAVVVAAECDLVVEFGFAAIGPVFYVVTIRRQLTCPVLVCIGWPNIEG